MKVSLNTVKQYIDFELPAVDELVRRINAQLGKVEQVIDLQQKYKDAVIVQVVTAEQHPDADRLRVCKVDDGGVTPDVPRDENGHVQIVCGAPNARAGIFAVWLPPNATVPSSFDDSEPFVLSARELRGVVSQGMLAAGDELAINSDHDGIIEIDTSEWKPTDVEVKPGVSFAKAYGLDDTIIDIENKMFTHRPDLFGQLGVAREIAGILGQTFKDPDWYWLIPTFEGASGLEIQTFNDVPEKVPRFMSVAMKDVTIKPSPLWLQCALVAMGSKSINNVVDVTNYAMLLTAQPSHAYDYDKLRGHKLGARMARAGEQALLLNGKTYELTEDDIVIADGEGIVGLAGIMGGGTSEVSAETKNIVLEVAVFDMYAVRKSSMRYGLFTDALTRFNKGQSPLYPDRTLSLIMKSLGDVAGAVQASDVYDFDGTLDHEGRRNINAEQTVTTQFINERLGLKLSDDEIGALLRNVHFACYAETSGELHIAAPDWRTDIVDPEDIVEEVGRLYGFDKLPRQLPERSISPATQNPKIAARQIVRQVLSRAGANEVLTYSFVHANVLTKAAQDPEQAFQLGNALSPDLQYYRISVLPSLLAQVHANIKSGHDEFVLFEVGKGHHVEALDEEELPREFDRVAAVYAAKSKSSKVSPYFAARRYVDALLSTIHAQDVQYRKLSEFDAKGFKPFIQLSAPFDADRSAVLMIGDKLAGVVGELKSTVRKGFKLPDQTAGFELFLSPFVGASTSAQYKPLSRYPSITQDISLKVAADIPYQDVITAIASAVEASQLDVSVAPIAVYQPVEDISTKTFSFRLKVTSHERTLRDEEVTTLLDTVAEAAKQSVAAERI